MVLSGYEVRAVIDDKQFAVLSSSRPFGRGSPKVRTTSARPGAMYSCSGRKKISSATPADVSSAIAAMIVQFHRARHDESSSCTDGTIPGGLSARRIYDVRILSVSIDHGVSATTTV